MSNQIKNNSQKKLTKHEHGEKQQVLVRKSAKKDKRLEKRYSPHKDYSKKKKMKTSRKAVLIILACFFGVIIIGASYAASIWINSDKYNSQTMFKPKTTASPAAPEKQENHADANAGGLDIGADSVLYNGDIYNYNKDIINLLFMGIDYEAKETPEGLILSGGQADTLILLAINTANNQLTLLNIPRDTLVEIKLYDINQTYAGNTIAQIALAHAYGDGKELSSQLTQEAVAKLLYGIPIYRYMSLNVAGIPAMTEALGGIAVTVPNDCTIDGKALKKGEQITLDSNQAQGYVQGRNDDLEANLSRMERQTSFLKGFFDKAKIKTKENIAFPISLYQAAGEYAATDMDLTEIAYLARVALNAGIKDENIQTIPGKMQQGKIFAEYITDDEALYKAILDIFYIKQPK